MTFFFEASYLLVEGEEWVPLVWYNNNTETYQASDSIRKGRHLTDWLSSNEKAIETVSFLRKFVLIV
jgi:hypothetical protein